MIFKIETFIKKRKEAGCCNGRSSTTRKNNLGKNLEGLSTWRRIGVDHREVLNNIEPKVLEPVVDTWLKLEACIKGKPATVRAIAITFDKTEKQIANMFYRLRKAGYEITTMRNGSKPARYLIE